MTSVAELRALRPNDPYLRWRVDAASPIEGVSHGSNLLWARRTKRGERWAYLFGDDAGALASLLERQHARESIDGITCPEWVRDALPERYLGPAAGHWSLWLLGAPTALDPGRARELEPDDPRIRPLLEHSSSAYVFPGDDRIARWIGVESEGALVAVAGHQRDTDGAAHVVSVCTDPAHRGRGLARQALSLLIDRALADDVPAVFLEMYVDNPPAAALYRSLGFSEVGRYYSWLIGVGGEPPLA